MSIALLKNVLFPAERKRNRPHTPLPVVNVHSQTGHTALASASASASNSDPAPTPSNQSHKHSEISWLSCESSVDLDSHLKRTSDPPPPLPEKELSNVQSAVSSDTDLEAHKPDGCDPPPKDPPSTKGWRFKMSPRMISDAIIGVSDGMTVPFALTAGLASLGDTKLVVLGGLAELIAGAISMGLGGFIGAKSEAESYQATVNSTRKLVRQSPFQTAALVRAVFEPYSLPPYAMPAILQPLLDSPTAMLDFLMRFHHQTAEPDAARPFVCALTISMGYFLGGLVPLIPYFCVHRQQVYLALWWSIGVMAVTLFAFGWVKTGVVVGWRGRSNVLAGLKGALQMVMIGGTAAGAAVGLVRAINHG